MDETETACRTRDGSYVDHDFWDDGSGYECRRCGATLNDEE
ncbi:hypothetical protein ACIA71_01725 [Streptomyces anulatus]